MNLQIVDGLFISTSWLVGDRGGEVGNSSCMLNMSHFFLKHVLLILMTGAMVGVFLLFREHAGIRQFERNYKTEESGREHSKESRPSRRECTRKNNIGFFKMHKCGSSTMQNILMRYGDRHNLNFVLPWRSNVFSQTHLRLSRDLVKSFPGHDYNILCHHTRYSKEGFDSLLPADSTYVTIIRDPTTLFESLYTYFRYDERFGVPLETFLENPQQYGRSNSYGYEGTGCYAKDSMLFELGLDDIEKADPKVIEEMIHRTASEFELVMIMEYFSESLILLKELMCWDIEDVSYFVVNGRATSFINKLSDETAERIRKWNDGNTKLYRFFNETFWRKVKKFGEDRMREEVAKLEELNKRMADRCVQTEILNAVWHPDGVDIKSYKVKDSARNDRDCQLITKEELAFTNYLRKKQLEKYFGLKLMDEL